VQANKGYVIIEKIKYIYRNWKVEVMESSPIWYYNEFQQIGVDYSRIEEARAYDLNMQQIRHINEEIKDVKASLNIGKNDSLLEIGTGTGEFAIGISKYCRIVYALDTSMAMLNIARKKAKFKKQDNIKFLHGGFLTYCHQGNPIDIVVSQLALHHLPDFWKFIALKRIYELLNKGGKFYLRDVVFPAIDDYFTFFDEIIEKIKSTAGEKVAEEVRAHIKQEYSTLDWIMEDLLKKAGFNIEKADYFNGFIAAYVCTK